LLMAFGKRGEIVPEKINLPEKVIAPSGIIQNQYEQFKRKIEIKKDGNYIDNKLCSLQEVAKKGKEWYKGSNEWIFLLIDESIPLSRIDEVREALTHNYWIVQSTVNSDDLVYFSGDVSKLAKFTQGKWIDWMTSQIGPFAKKYKDGNYKITYSFIIGKDGKVRDGHIIKGCDNPEINTEFEKILTQIPDWQPAIRLDASASVYYREVLPITIVHK